MRFIKDQEKRMNVKRGKKKSSKSDGKVKCMETAAKDDSWLAIQRFPSLKRKLIKAQEAVVKARKSYEDAAKSLTFAENTIKSGVRGLRKFARVVETNKKDAKTIIWITKEYGFTGLVSVVDCKKRAKLVQILKEDGIAAD
ncbi:hypothetical protein ACP275_09G008700 [Erythranthe tilingii]